MHLIRKPIEKLYDPSFFSRNYPNSVVNVKLSNPGKAHTRIMWAIPELGRQAYLQYPPEQVIEKVYSHPTYKTMKEMSGNWVDENCTKIVIPKNFQGMRAFFKSGKYVDLIFFFDFIFNHTNDIGTFLIFSHEPGNKLRTRSSVRLDQGKFYKDKFMSSGSKTIISIKLLGYFFTLFSIDKMLKIGNLPGVIYTEEDFILTRKDRVEIAIGSWFGDVKQEGPAINFSFGDSKHDSK